MPQGGLQGVLHELQKLYYDCAQASNPYAMGTLAKLVSTSNARHSRV